MAVERTIVPEWRDEQAQSRYPFTDASTLVSTTGVFIDKDFFLDAVVYVLNGSAPLYLAAVTFEGQAITVSITDSGGTTIITGQINPYETNTSIPLYDLNGRSAGVLVSDEDRLKRFQSWPAGTQSFGTNAEFVASVIVPFPEKHLSGFILPDGSIVSGDVWFFGENGVLIRQDDDGSIRFDLVGDPLFKRSLCDITVNGTQGFVTPNFLKTINGIPPDSNGNFLISVNDATASDSILRIYPDTSENAVKIEFVGQRLESVL